MRLLALDTATEACSVALWQAGKVVERFEVVGRSHTERLLPMVQALIAEAGISFKQLDGFVCGVGPGSFAGVRIGVGFVKGLALALDRPVVPVTSLAMLAQGAAPATQILACIDARMKEVYFGAFVRDGSGLVHPSSAAVVSAPEALNFAGDGEWTGAGSGWCTYETPLRQSIAADISSINGTALPHAADALILALPQFRSGTATTADALAPIYLRDKVALNLGEQAALRRPALL